MGVIASLPDLRRATRLRRPPDLFELRLDALYPITASAERLMAKLKRPLIISARHPAEGGRNDLSAMQRRKLLLHFLPVADFVDIELRAAFHLRAVLEAAAKRQVPRIISLHELRRTPSLQVFRRLANRAEKLSPDIFKIVTRTDRAADLARLLAFFDEQYRRYPLAVMGIGRLGKKSRIALSQRGSLLHYVHLGAALVPGQFSLTEAQVLPSPRVLHQSQAISPATPDVCMQGNNNARHDRPD